MPERIDRAAIYANGIICSGNTINDCRRMLPPTKNLHDLVKGFITSKGRFVTAQEAYHIALERGQLKTDRPLKELFPEDLVHA